MCLFLKMRILARLRFDVGGFFYVGGRLWAGAGRYNIYVFSLPRERFLKSDTKRFSGVGAGLKPGFYSVGFSVGGYVFGGWGLGAM